MDIKILGTIAAALIIFAIGIFVSVKISKKKFDIVGSVGTAEKVITYAQAVATAISPFLPTIDNTAIAFILEKAQQAIEYVENIYKSAIATGSTVDDVRKSEATDLIKAALKLEKIEDTAQIDKLINTVVPLLVLALPKTHDTAAEIITPVQADTGAQTGTAATA
jgi:hypothetical protein